jgi:RNA polymerase sigma-70 factor (ECF subfamily)
VPDFKRSIAAEIPYLRRYALRLAKDPDRADDLVQDCLERALRKRHLWLGRGHIRSWLYRVLHNVHVNGCRHPQDRYVTTTAHDEAVARLAEPARQDRRMECRDMAAALGRLPMEQREAVVLIGVEGRPYEEAAVMLGIPVGTVRSRLARGREALRSMTDSPPRYGYR